MGTLRSDTNQSEGEHTVATCQTHCMPHRRDKNSAILTCFPHRYCRASGDKCDEPRQRIKSKQQTRGREEMIPSSPSSSSCLGLRIANCDWRTRQFCRKQNTEVYEQRGDVTSMTSQIAISKHTRQKNKNTFLGSRQNRRL